MNQEIHIEKASTCLLEDGILQITFKSGKLIQPEDLWEIKRIDEQLTGNKPYTVLVQAEELTNFSVETRQLTASKEFKGLTIAKALLFEGLAQRIIVNFYMKVNMPYTKTKAFSEREKALEWLREEYQLFLTENKSVVSDESAN